MNAITPNLACVPTLIASLGIALLIAMTSMTVGCAPAKATANPMMSLPVMRTVLDADALLMPTCSKFGRAINGVSYQQEALLTHGNWQYAIWYTRADQTLLLARRSIDGRTPQGWETIRLDGSTLVNGGPPSDRAGYRTWNSHNVAVLGICPADGTVHVFYDMHASRLRYRVSVPGLADGEATWAGSSFKPERSWLEAPEKPVPSMTYPRMAAAPDGTLVLLYRVGGSGNGDLVIQRYCRGAWTAPCVVVNRSGEYVDRFGTSPGRNAYENGLSVDRNGALHLSWTWRERDPVSNQGIGYAFSADEGKIWRAADGTAVADTSKGESIGVGTEHVWVNAMDRSIGTVNQQAQLVDHQGRPHVVMFHRRGDKPYREEQGFWPSGVQSYFHYFHDALNKMWVRRQLPGTVGTRPKLGIDPAVNLYLIYQHKGTLTVQRATREARYDDWQVVHTERGPFTGEMLIDPNRLRRDGVLSIFAQRDGPASDEPTGTALEVIDVRVTSIAK
jgi:hypothetical protein